MAETPTVPEPDATRFDRILFPTDFTPASAAALPYAAAIARRFRSTIPAAHVIHPESYAHLPESERKMALEGMRHEAEARINGLLAHARFQGVPHHVLIASGEVLPELSSMVEKYDVDLVVAASHGKHGIHKLLTGSVVEEIARLAACPVLLIGPAVRVAPEEEVHLDHILYVTDFAPGSVRALAYAYALAEAYHAHLDVLHVIEAIWTEPLATRVSGEDFCRLRFAERGWPSSKGDITPDFLLLNGSAETQTLQTAADRGVQLLVLNIPGTSHPDLQSHLPGPFAYNIVSHARCPVLAVHDHQTPGGSL